MSDPEHPQQEQDNSHQGPHAHLNASQLGGEEYAMHQQNQPMEGYPQDYDPAAMHLQQDPMMMHNDSLESGNNYDPMNNFPLEALAPFNQGLAAFAGEADTRGQKLKEARLMEALERQTSLLDSIAQSYQKNRELRHKADLRKLKNRLEKLENQKLFRELELQQMEAANDIAHQNNQLIFSHLNAQAQLKANPVVLNIGQSSGGFPPFGLLPNLNPFPSPHQPFGAFPPFPPMGFPPGGLPPRNPPFGPQWGQPQMRPTPFLGANPAGPRSGPLPPLGLPPFGYNRGPPLRLPPIDSSRKKRKKNDSNSSSDSDESSSKKSKRKTRGADVDKYLDKMFDKHKRK